MKAGKYHFAPALRARNFRNCPYRYAEKTEMFERVFGADRVTVRPYMKSALAGGCVVHDFCRTLGIQLEPRSVITANTSLCADAVKMLYAYNRMSSMAAKFPPMGWRHAMTVSRLAELPGAPFRFHSSLLGEVRAEIDSQNGAMWRKYGIDISEDIEAADRGPCIRSEEDLLRFSRASLDWLSDTTATARIGPMEGEAAAGEVALRVACLWKRIPTRSQGRMVLERLRSKTKRVLRGE